MIKQWTVAIGVLIGSAGFVYAVSEASRSVVASGGVSATATVHTIQATIGQDLVGTATSANHTITGGFWVPTLDLFDFADFNQCVTGPDGGAIPPECRAADFDNDGDVDLRDMAAVQREFTG